jgi:hypothetical protein
MVFAFFKGPFESAGCTFEEDGWVTTDINRGERIKWRPFGKQAFRWDVIENQWVPSSETRSEFLAIARQYKASVRRRR